MRLVNADNICVEAYAGCDKCTIKELLNQEPTVQAAPIVYAHWIHIYSGLNEDWDFMVEAACSRCGGVDEFEYGDAPAYCRKCGARMHKDVVRQQR